MWGRGPIFLKTSSSTRITLRHFFLIAPRSCPGFAAEADQEPDQPNQLGDDDSDVDNDDDGDVDNDDKEEEDVDDSDGGNDNDEDVGGGDDE